MQMSTQTLGVNWPLRWLLLTVCVFQTSKPEKELMKPLYDRYRTIKRVIAKPPSVSKQCEQTLM